MVRSKLSKRKRKKLRKGEFTETGFSVTFYHVADKNGTIRNKFIDLVQSKGMYCGGGGTEKKGSYFVSRKRKAIAEKERINFLEDIKNIQGINHIISLELQDTWYGDSEKYFEKLEELEKNYERRK